jgi:hypothetical protein
VSSQSELFAGVVDEDDEFRHAAAGGDLAIVSELRKQKPKIKVLVLGVFALVKAC